MSAHGRTRGRLQRPELPRDRPIRGFSTLFDAPGAAGGPVRAEVRAEARPEAGGAGAGDPVARGVAAGYRVIEEYLRRGQQAAKAASPPSAAEKEETGEPGRSAKLTERMLHYASDFAAVWLELMQTLMLANPAVQERQGDTMGPFAVGRDRAAAAPTGAAAPAAPPTSAAPPDFPLAPVTCAVEVECRRPVEVSWELRPEASASELAVHPLQAAGAAIPALTAASIERATGERRLVVRIRVPDEQPPGVYTGLVVDRDTNMPAGVLVVRLSG